jgi:dienelactone hydrolase
VNVSFRALALCAVVGLSAMVRPASAENVAIPQAAGPDITGYMSRPKGPGPFPAVLVLHGCSGLRELEIATVDGLARQGYVGVAIDTLKPQGLKNACEVKGARRVSAQYAAASLAWLVGQSYVRGDSLGVVGFSMGATEILDLIDPLTAQAPPPSLRVAVAYYPACSGRDGAVTAPLLILDGDADDWTPAGSCQELARAGVASGKTVEITTYPGATHSFNVPRRTLTGEVTYLGHTLRYDASATADAEAKTNAFLGRYLR